MIKTELDHFLRMTTRQFAIGDFDAEHPVCMNIADRFRLSAKDRLWLCFLYMAFYDEASMWATFEHSDPFTIPKVLDYPIGKNRRNLWGGRIKAHFVSLKEMYKTAANWPFHNFVGDPRKDWMILKENIGTVWGNGRFAKYTTAEMIQKVCNIDVEITDFDNRNSSGPRDGILRVSGCDDNIRALDAAGEEIYQRVLKSKLKPTYTKVDRGVVESVLCNYSGICRGCFYSGRNLDRQQARIVKVETEHDYNLDLLWDTRVRVFKKAHLGEHAGWDGIDKSRLTLFRDHNKLLWTHEERHLGQS